MATKAQKLKELEEQYKAHLKEIEESADDEDGDDDDDIIVLRGNARKQFLARLEKMGLSGEEAAEVEEEAAEEVDADGNPIETPETQEPKAKGKTKGKPVKEEVPTEDPKPPSRVRYFGGK